MEIDVSDRQLDTQRVLPWPPETVFAALTNPETLARWWGPAGFSNTFEVCDLRPGGLWRFVMHGPDGHDYPNEARFAELTAPSRFVVEHVSGPHFVLTLTLTAADGGKRLHWRQEFDSPEVCAQVAKFAVEANEQNLDRLAAVVGGAA
jgi:uncharacterized protein YndB with AHSA1/START domain